MLWVPVEMTPWAPAAPGPDYVCQRLGDHPLVIWHHWIYHFNDGLQTFAGKGLTSTVDLRVADRIPHGLRISPVSFALIVGPSEPKKSSWRIFHFHVFRYAPWHVYPVLTRLDLLDPKYSDSAVLPFAARGSRRAVERSRSSPNSMAGVILIYWRVIYIYVIYIYYKQTNKQPNKQTNCDASSSLSSPPNSAVSVSF